MMNSSHFAMAGDLRSPILCEETGKVYLTIDEAAQDLGIHRAAIRRALFNNTKAAGFTLRFHKLEPKTPTALDAFHGF
eukprot:g12170.t1